VIFYSTEISGNRGWLDHDESRHCVKVLRLEAGDEIQVVDGKGNLYRAEITDANSKKCGFIIQKTERDFGKRNYELHIAIAPTKNMDRMEWFVEKTTEIGVERIIPILCKNSERRVLKNERLERKMISAIKQSKKALLPELMELQKLETFLAQDFNGEKFIAHCHELPKMDLSKVYQKGKDVLILIGPEGDFSEDELRMATGAGFKPVNLSGSRLRTETAGIVACSTINTINGS
jgi:16S rRNA (uracil1498-N3)-methyltransferase